VRIDEENANKSSIVVANGLLSIQVFFYVNPFHNVKACFQGKIE